MTTLEDAWGIKIDDVKSPYQTINNKKVHDTSPELNHIDPFNMKGDYDEYVINVDTFKPHRIELIINDSDVVGHLKTMTTEAQQVLATQLLLDYFKANPTKYGIIDKVVLNRPIVTEPTIIEPTNYVPTSTAVSRYDPMEEMYAGVEYMRHQEPNVDKTFLCVLLLVVIWIFIDRIFNVIQHA